MIYLDVCKGGIPLANNVMGHILPLSPWIDFSRGSPMPANDFNDSSGGMRSNVCPTWRTPSENVFPFEDKTPQWFNKGPFVFCLGRKAESAGNGEKKQWSSEWWVSFCLFFFFLKIFFYCFVDARCYKYRMRNLPRPISMLRALTHRMPGILVQLLPWDSLVTTCITCCSNIYLLGGGGRKLQLALSLISKRHLVGMWHFGL